MTGQMTYSFIKAIIRNELMFNSYYLHNYCLTIMPYFNMVRKVKAAKKPALGEILLTAMAGGPCVQLSKRIWIRRNIKWGAEVLVGKKWLPKEEGYWEIWSRSLSSRQWLRDLVYYSPEKLGLDLRGWKTETMQLTWSEDGEGLLTTVTATKRWS